MLAADRPFELLIRALAPVVWRNDRRIAAKLEEFAETEAGSALDMLEAAERVDDPKLRRLFFVHAMDEARHAQLFRDLARRVDPERKRRVSKYALIHARRQRLFRRLGLVGFLALVHLAERRGEAHFRALRRHFAGRSGLEDVEATFDRIAKEERFHASYSARALRLEAGSPRAVRARLVEVRLRRGWEAWRRQGKKIGDAAARAVLLLLYFFVLPPFAVVQRLLDPEQPGWKAGRRVPDTIERARRQY